jgi:uncharacterized protein (UPF0147 family)
MVEEISEIIATLEPLLDDLPHKVKIELEKSLNDLKKINTDNLDINMLMKIQDDFEAISNMSNVDYFTRNEIMNSVAIIESIYNG